MTSNRNLKESDAYADKVKKLIPAEVSAAFLAINSSIQFGDDYFIYSLSFFIILIPICWLYLLQFQNVGSKIQLFFTTFIAFPLWAANMAIDRIDFLADKRFLPAAGLIIVTLVAPLVIAKQERG
jgi:hypothetical protein